MSPHNLTYDLRPLTSAFSCPCCHLPLDDYQSRGESFAHPLRNTAGQPNACPLAGRYHSKSSWQHYSAVVAYAAAHPANQTHQTHLAILS